MDLGNQILALGRRILTLGSRILGLGRKISRPGNQIPAFVTAIFTNNPSIWAVIHVSSPAQKNNKRTLHPFAGNWKNFFAVERKIFSTMSQNRGAGKVLLRFSNACNKTREQQSVPPAVLTFMLRLHLIENSYSAEGTIAWGRGCVFRRLVLFKTIQF